MLDDATNWTTRGGSVSRLALPPLFAAQFAEVIVDVETGKVVVEKLLMAVDAGVIVNPTTASGQVEGGMTQALGYAVCEEMYYDDQGEPRERDLVDHRIFRADEMPELDTLFIEAFEPSHPFWGQGGVRDSYGWCCSSSRQRYPRCIWRENKHHPNHARTGVESA